MKALIIAIAAVLPPLAAAAFAAPGDMALIKGGTFLMGSPETENWREADEVRHTVAVSDFYIGTREVTQKEYVALTGKNPSEFKGNSLPVESVSWYDAVAFCNLKSAKEGLTPAYVIDGGNVTWNRDADGYRLPTEAEWEYAARAGSEGPFSVEPSPSPRQANYYGHYPYNIEQNYFTTEKLDVQPGIYRAKTLPVGSFKPNAWGLYDVHGNVSEWCWDRYGAYPVGPATDPAGPGTGAARVCRGGGWNDFAKHLRSAYRSSQTPDDVSASRGFRLARNAKRPLAR